MPDTFSIGGGYQQSPEYSEKLPLRVYQRRTGSLDTFSKGRPDKHRPVPRALRGIRQYVGSVATNCHKHPQGQMHSIRSMVDEIRRIDVFVGVEWRKESSASRIPQAIGRPDKCRPEYSEKLSPRVYQRCTRSSDTFSKGWLDKPRPVFRACTETAPT